MKYIGINFWWVICLANGSNCFCARPSFPKEKIYIVDKSLQSKGPWWSIVVSVCLILLWMMPPFKSSANIHQVRLEDSAMRISYTNEVSIMHGMVALFLFKVWLDLFTPITKLKCDGWTEGRLYSTSSITTRTPHTHPGMGWVGGQRSRSPLLEKIVLPDIACHHSI